MKALLSPWMYLNYRVPHAFGVAKLEIRISTYNSLQKVYLIMRQAVSIRQRYGQKSYVDNPYKVTAHGEKLGIGSRDFELVDVMPLEFPERSSATYIAA